MRGRFCFPRAAHSQIVFRMLYLRTVLATLSGLLIFVAGPTLTYAASPTVVFSEIAWAGSSLSAADEWIELFNPTNQPISLAGYTLEGGSKEPLVLPEEANLFPHSTYLISNYASSNEKTILATAPDLVDTSLSLSNSQLGLVLRNADGVIVDQAGSGGSAFAGRSGGTGGSDDGRYISMARRDLLLAGDQKEAWEDAVSSTGLKEGVRDLANPGFFAAISLSEDDSLLEEESANVEESANESLNESPPAPINIPVGTLVINEFVSDPIEGEEEWIEIRNPYNNVIRLTNWSIEDASGKKTYLPDQLFGREQIIVIHAPKGKLNNGSDTIILRDATNTLIDRLDYGTKEHPAPKKGQSLARNQSGGYFISEVPSRGLPNQEPVVIPEMSEIQQTSLPVFIPTSSSPSVVSISLEPQEPMTPKLPMKIESVAVPAIKERPAKIYAQWPPGFISPDPPVADTPTPVVSKPKITSTPKPATKKISVKKASAPAMRTLDLSELRELDRDRRVLTHGVVTALPGQIARQSFYVQDQGRGIEVYKNDALFPDLALGDHVQIGATYGQAYGHDRLKMSKADLVVVKKTEQVVEPVSIVSNEIARYDAQLVTVRGHIHNKSSNSLTLEDAHGTIDIDAPYNQTLQTSSLAYDQIAEVTGILITSNGSTKLHLRTLEDLVLVPQKQDTLISGSTQTIPPKQHVPMSIGIWVMAFTLTTLGAFLVRHLIPRISQYYATSFRRAAGRV